MSPIRQWQKLQTLFREYPSQFWILITAVFIDSLGGATLRTFIALYITQKFDVGLAEVGIILGASGLARVAGGIVGGALTDQFGRKIVIIVALVMSALLSIGMGLTNSLIAMGVIAGVAGFLESTGAPAAQSMVADLLPGEKRAEGFGILRVGANLSGLLGPLIGGFFIGYSYMLLFVADAIASTIMAGIVCFALVETARPIRKAKTEQSQASFLTTLRDYSIPLRDTVYTTFLILCILTGFAYFQTYETFTIFLRDAHAIAPQHIGYLFSLNCAAVILFQLWITRKIRRFSPMLSLTAACLILAVGLGICGLAETYMPFIVATIIIVIAEMIFYPTTQAFAAEKAPKNMRGRYMALYGFIYTIPRSFCVLVASLIMTDTADNAIWYVASGACLVAAGAFLILHRGIAYQQKKLLTVVEQPGSTVI